MPQSFIEYFPSPRDILGHDDSDYSDRVVSDGMTKQDRHIRHLISDTFHDHGTPGRFGKVGPLTAAPDGAMRIVSRDAISLRFRERFMADFKISLTRNKAPEDVASRVIPTFDDFVEQITAPPVEANQRTEGSNYLSFVTGDVGTGKSLVMVKLMDRIHATNLTRPANGLRCMPVYIDLETAWGHNDGKFKRIDDSFYELISTRMLAAAAEHKLELSEFYKDCRSSEESKNSSIRLKGLCKWLPRQGHYALIILDNMDRFHFAHTRYSFFEQYKRRQLDSIKRNILKLHRDFQDGNHMGGLSATIIMVCREEVVRHSFQSNDGAERRHTKNEPVFQVHGVDADEVVRKRIELLGSILDEIRPQMTPAQAERYDKARRILDRAMQAAESASGRNDPPLRILRYVCALSHQGLRSFLEFLAGLDIDGSEECDVIARVLELSPRNLLRLYITNMNKRFRQRQNHFPNLFLNDCRANPHDRYPQAHNRPHKQTYWLKYLILKIIDAQPKGCIEFETLHRMLCDVCGYEDELVRLMVGILASPNHFRCIDIEYDGERIGTRKLTISKRGRLLVGDQGANDYLPREPLCFSFDYLQLVIDDPWLRYPQRWTSAIALAGVNLGYTLKPSVTYRTEGLNYIRKKVPATLHFLRVLQASWASERQRIANLAPSLLATLGPNFDEISVRLLEGIGSVLRTYEGGEGIHADFQDDWRHLHEDADFDGWWVDFRRENPAVSH